MSDHFQLSRYEIQDAGSGNILVLVSGSWVYYRILTDAFQEYRFSRGFEDRRVRYDWGTYIYNIGPEDRKRVQKLLDLFTEAVCIQDSLNQSFALSYHMQYVDGQLVRTEIGELVYNAKPYNRPPTPQNRERAATLADHLAQFITCHPSYARSDLIVPVPPSNSNKPFDLPNFLVEKLCARLNKENGKAYVRKVKTTAPMKDFETEREKFENIRGAFEVVENTSLQGRRIILVDDIYESGATLHELASEFRRAGAEVFGLVATKTMRDPC